MVEREPIAGRAEALQANIERARYIVDMLGIDDPELAARYPSAKRFRLDPTNPRVLVIQQRLLGSIARQEAALTPFLQEIPTSLTHEGTMIFSGSQTRADDKRVEARHAVGPEEPPLTERYLRRITISLSRFLHNHDFSSVSTKQLASLYKQLGEDQRGWIRVPRVEHGKPTRYVNYVDPAFADELLVSLSRVVEQKPKEEVLEWPPKLLSQVVRTKGQGITIREMTPQEASAAYRRWVGLARDYYRRTGIPQDDIEILINLLIKAVEPYRSGQKGSFTSFGGFYRFFQRTTETKRIDYLRVKQAALRDWLERLEKTPKAHVPKEHAEKINERIHPEGLTDEVLASLPPKDEALLRLYYLPYTIDPQKILAVLFELNPAAIRKRVERTLARALALNEANSMSLDHLVTQYHLLRTRIQTSQDRLPNTFDLEKAYRAGDFPCNYPALIKRFGERTWQATQARLEQRLKENYAQLYEEVKPLVHKWIRFIANDFLDEVDNLTDIAIEEIFRDLPTFDPTLGKGDHERNFRNWCITIAKNVARKHRRRMKRSAQTHELSGNEVYSFREEESKPRDPSTFLSKIQEGLSDILSPLQFQIVVLHLKGRKNREIATLLRCSEYNVASKLSEARRIIEQKRLFPAGYKRLPRFTNQVTISTARLRDVARRSGKLQTLPFLGLRYATDEAFRYYQQNQREIKQGSPVHKGYVLLSEHTTADEYHDIRVNPSYAHLLNRYQNRIYIEPDDLDGIRKTKIPAKPRRKPSPGPEYKQLIHLAHTPYEYGKLQHAALRGRLQAVKQGYWWFATQEAVNEFWRNQNSVSEVEP